MEQTGSNVAYKLYPIQGNILRRGEKKITRNFFFGQQVLGQECKKAGFGDSNTQDEENV